LRLGRFVERMEVPPRRVALATHSGWRSKKQSLWRCGPRLPLVPCSPRNDANVSGLNVPHWARNFSRQQSLLSLRASVEPPMAGEMIFRFCEASRLARFFPTQPRCALHSQGFFFFHSCSR
jgi:hypothetical protein